MWMPLAVARLMKVELLVNLVQKLMVGKHCSLYRKVT